MSTLNILAGGNQTASTATQQRTVKALLGADGDAQVFGYAFSSSWAYLLDNTTTTHRSNFFTKNTATMGRLDVAIPGLYLVELDIGLQIVSTDTTYESAVTVSTTNATGAVSMPMTFIDRIGTNTIRIQGKERIVAEFPAGSYFSWSTSLPSAASMTAVGINSVAPRAMVKITQLRSNYS